jgi:hypothetical protein
MTSQQPSPAVTTTESIKYKAEPSSTIQSKTAMQLLDQLSATHSLSPHVQQLRYNLIEVRSFCSEK